MRSIALKAVTELGEEKYCLCCGEYWPADTEFFESRPSSKDGLSPRCLACIEDKVWVYRRPHRYALPEKRDQYTH